MLIISGLAIIIWLEITGSTISRFSVQLSKPLHYSAFNPIKINIKQIYIYIFMRRVTNMKYKKESSNSSQHFTFLAMDP